MKATNYSYYTIMATLQGYVKILSHDVYLQKASNLATDTGRMHNDIHETLEASLEKLQKEFSKQLL